MIKIKKIIFLIIKFVIIFILFSTLILFFYAAFFYKPPSIERNITENQIEKSEEYPDIEEEKKLNKEEQKLKESQLQEKIGPQESEQTSNTAQDKTKIKRTEIKDSLFMTIGNIPVTRSDIVNEIKIILILNNESYSDDKREKLQELAVKQIIKRDIKQIELNKHNFFEFNEQDLQVELTRLADAINVDVDILKNICASNDLDFAIIENQIKVELYWNSLIFQIYKNKLKVSSYEIDEQLKLIQTKKKIEEYLISEILVKVIAKDKLESEIKELKNKIEIEGFENVAKSLSISESAINGGDLGWLNENVISKKIKHTIANTPVGSLSEPILLPQGILIFKIRNKREIRKNLSLEEAKNLLVKSEKTKILRMHSLSHYDKARRSVSVKFFQ